MQPAETHGLALRLLRWESLGILFRDRAVERLLALPRGGVCVVALAVDSGPAAPVFPRVPKARQPLAPESALVLDVCRGLGFVTMGRASVSS